MSLLSSLMFSFRMVFPKTEKASSARKSFFGAVVCIAISLVPLVVVMSVADGVIFGMTERIIGLSSSHITAYMPAVSEYAKTADAIKTVSADVAGLDGVTHAFPEISVTALAASGTYRTGAHVRAVAPEIFYGKSLFSKLFEVQEGDVLSFGRDGDRTAVIGTKLAKLLGVGAGDKFRVISLSENAAGMFVPKNVQLTVAAVVSSGYQELDSLWLFVPIDVAYSSLPLSNANIMIRAETADAFAPELQKIKSDIEEKLGGMAVAYDWSELNASQLENFSSTKVILVFIMMLIVLVAAVNISAALVMLVMERQKEIAIIKSIGGTARGVTLSFLVVGFAAGLCGVVAGLPLGIACAVNSNKIIAFTEKVVNAAAEFFYALQGGQASGVAEIKLFNPEYYLTEIPVSLPFAGLFAITLATLVLSVVVSVIPSVRAGREKPLETLRKS